jgi:DNA-binding XRE family transcriptional regulator
MGINALKLARMRQGMTQLDLAKRAGISEKMVSFYETERGQPKVELAVDISRILGADPAEVFPGMFANGAGK